jgi:hypothetical protein
VSGVRISWETFGDEVAAHCIVALSLGDVLRQQQLLAVAVRTHGELHRAARPRRREAHRLLERAALQVRHEGRGAHEVRDALAAVALRIEPEVVRGDRVAPFDLIAGIDEQHAVGRGFDRGQELVKPRAFRLDAAFQQAHRALDAIAHLAPEAGVARCRPFGLSTQPLHEAMRAPRVDEGMHEDGDARAEHRTARRVCQARPTAMPSSAPTTATTAGASRRGISQLIASLHIQVDLLPNVALPITPLFPLNITFFPIPSPPPLSSKPLLSNLHYIPTLSTLPVTLQSPLNILYFITILPFFLINYFLLHYHPPPLSLFILHLTFPSTPYTPYFAIFLRHLSSHLLLIIIDPSNLLYYFPFYLPSNNLPTSLSTFIIFPFIYHASLQFLNLLNSFSTPHPPFTFLPL